MGGHKCPTAGQSLGDSPLVTQIFGPNPAQVEGAGMGWLSETKPESPPSEPLARRWGATHPLPAFKTHSEIGI